MKRLNNFSHSFLIFFILTLLFHFNVNAQDSDNALLWKISGKGIEKPSYLFGTIHLICPEDLVISDALKTAFDQTDQLVLEIDLSDPKVIMELQQKLLNPNMTNTQNQFSEEDKELVDQFLIKEYGAGLSQFGVLKPFGILSLVIAKLVPCPQPASYEIKLGEMAKQNNMKTGALETVDYQLSLFDNMPQDTILDGITQTIREFDKMQAEFQNLVEAYKNQDLEKMGELIEESSSMTAFMDQLLNKRNKEWMPKIVGMLNEESSSFIAVGAGHLGSDNGLVRLLRKQGYTVEPVKLE